MLNQKRDCVNHNPVYLHGFLKILIGTLLYTDFMERTFFIFYGEFRVVRVFCVRKNSTFLEQAVRLSASILRIRWGVSRAMPKPFQ
jgi:hypothetical protein